MKKKMIIAVAVVMAAALLALGGVAGYRAYYNNTHVFIENAVYEKDAQSISLRGTGASIEHYEALRAALPECEVLWDLPFQGGYLSLDTTELTLASLTEEEIPLLDYLPDLKLVKAEGCTDYAALMALKDHRPDCEITYLVELEGAEYPQDVKELSFQDADAVRLKEMLVYLPAVQSVAIEAPTMPARELLELVAAYPEIDFSWNATVLGTVYPSDTTALDFSNVQLESVDALEAELAYLPALETVEVHNCGIDSETLSAWRERQAENYKVVWTVNLGWGIDLRTDAKTFMPVMMNQGTGRVWDKTLVELKYCNELICIDVGHMPISHCDWAAYMPDLQYLIVADTGINSIEGVRGLQNLIYLEIFTTPITDYSPLLECPNLKDLNMVNSRGDPDVIVQLTSLERLWWGDGGSYHVELSNADKDRIRAAMPNAELQLGVLNPTSMGWRKGKLYYEMRDILGMPYFGQ